MPSLTYILVCKLALLCATISAVPSARCGEQKPWRQEGLAEEDVMRKVRGFNSYNAQPENAKLSTDYSRFLKQEKVTNMVQVGVSRAGRTFDAFKVCILRLFTRWVCNSALSFPLTLH